MHRAKKLILFDEKIIKVKKKVIIIHIILTHPDFIFF